MPTRAETLWAPQGLPTIQAFRWPNRTTYYKFGYGCGYFIKGEIHDFNHPEAPVKKVNPAKQLQLFYDNLTFFKERAKEYGEVGPFIVVDDGSPIKVDLDQVAELTDPHPLAYITFPHNGGVGMKEHVVQVALASVTDYIIRWDVDIKMDPFPLRSFLMAFKEDIPDAWVIAPCITYFARLYEASLAPDVRYFSGANLADMACFRSEVFRRVGYSDPFCKVNNDGELRLRALGALGWKCYVDRTLTGKARPSGAGSGTDKRIIVGEHLKETRPWLQVVFPEGKGTFRLSLNKKRAAEAKETNIAPNTWACEVRDTLWDL